MEFYNISMAIQNIIKINDELFGNNIWLQSSESNDLSSSIISAFSDTPDNYLSPNMFDSIVRNSILENNITENDLEQLLHRFNNTQYLVNTGKLLN